MDGHRSRLDGPQILAALSAGPSANTEQALASLAVEVREHTGLDASRFLSRMIDERRPVVDVRSPGEFAQGHIPGAHSLPLFSDHERAVVGTVYKHQGREAAMVQGMRCTCGPTPLTRPPRMTVTHRATLALCALAHGLRSSATHLLSSHTHRAAVVSQLACAVGRRVSQAGPPC